MPLPSQLLHHGHGVMELTTMIMTKSMKWQRHHWNTFIWHIAQQSMNWFCSIILNSSMSLS